MLTGWNLSHLIMHFFAGMIAPDYFFLDFIAGVSFEVFEARQWKAQDPTDIICNVTGFWAGKYFVENYYK